MKRFKCMKRALVTLLVLSICLSSMYIPVEAGSASAEYWFWPVPEVKSLSRGFKSGHPAIDIQTSGCAGSAVYASKSGTICRRYTGCNNWNGANNDTCQNRGICNPNYGYCKASGVYGMCNEGMGRGFIIKQDDGYYVQYAHMDSLANLKEGDEVEQGTYLGSLGSYGNSTGPHLHFEIGTEMYGGQINNNPTNSDIIWYDTASSYTKAINYVYDKNIVPEIDVTFENSSRTSIGETSAVLGAILRVSGVAIKNVSKVGIELYKENPDFENGAEFVTEKYEVPKTSGSYIDIWYNTDASELNVTLESGKKYYYFFVAEINGKLYNSDRFEFIPGAAGYSDVWTSKGIYELDDTVTISVSPISANGAWIGINKKVDGNWERVITAEAKDFTYSVKASEIGVGEYQTYFSVYNSSGSMDTRIIDFVVAEPVDLGDNFNAKIKNPSTNKYFASVNSNVQGEDANGEPSQNWRFERQSDGSYKIISLLDERVLDVYDSASSGGGANVQVFKNWESDAQNQRYYIYDAFGAYYIKPLCCDMFLDMDQNSPHNVAVWGGGNDWPAQEFEIKKLNSEEDLDSDIIASGQCGEDVYWTFDKDNNLTITGTGPMKDYASYMSLPWRTLGDGKVNVIIEDGVTRIGECCFEQMNIESIIIADSVTEIGAYAFSACGAIEEIQLPEGLEKIETWAFHGCMGLKSIDFPESLKQIGKLAFFNSGLEGEIVIPASVNNIGIAPFCDTSVQSVQVNKDNQEYESIEGVLVDKSEQKIVQYPNNKSDETYTTPEGITSIGVSAFKASDYLKEIVISDSVVLMESSSFSSISTLEKITILNKDCIINDNNNTIASGAVIYGYADSTAQAYAEKYERVFEVLEEPVVDEVIANGYSGSTTWTLTESGILKFTGNGVMKHYSYKSEMPWYPYLDQIKSVVIEEGVTRIGDYSFYGMTELTSVTIPDTVTAIGEYAFKNAAALDNVVLPEGLTKLGESAFYECTSLTSIEIPASLWTVQPYTFKNCTALTEVTFTEGDLQKISDGAFYNTGLTEVILPDCLDILDVYSFKNCTDLADITIGSGLTELREAVFYGTAISTIEIPEGITKIGPYAFKNCANLEAVSLPSTLEIVGEASFYACTDLAGLELPDAVTNIGNYAFRRCTGLTSVTFGEELVTIGECSFYGCTGITEIVIPDKVTGIEPYAFKGCTKLKDVTLGESVANIKESAFYTCTALKTLVFPASVATIGEYCFSGSYNLWKLTFEGDAPAIGTGAFKGLAATAYYPAENTSWTDAVMQNYGGKISWKAN